MQPHAEQLAEGDSCLELEDLGTPNIGSPSEEELVSMGEHFDDVLKQPLHRINEPPADGAALTSKPPGGTAAISLTKAETDKVRGSRNVGSRRFKEDLANSLRRAVRFVEPNQIRKLRFKDYTNKTDISEDESLPGDLIQKNKEAWTISESDVVRSPTRQAFASPKDIQTWLQGATQSIHNLGRSHSRVATGTAAGNNQELVPKSQFFTWEMLNKAAQLSRSLHRQPRKNACARLWLPGNGDTIDWSGAGLASSEKQSNRSTSHYSSPYSSQSPHAQHESRGVSRMRWSDNTDADSTTCSSRRASVDSNSSSLWRTASITLQHTLTRHWGNTFLTEEEAALSIATYGTPDHNIWIAIGSPGARVTVYSLKANGTIKQVASLSAPLTGGLTTLNETGRRHTSGSETIAAARRRSSISSDTSAGLVGKGRPRNSEDGGSRFARPGPCSGINNQNQQLPVQVEIQGPLIAVGGSGRLSSRQTPTDDGEVWLYEWDTELCKYTYQTAIVADGPCGHGGGFGHSLCLHSTGSGPSRTWRLAVGAPNFDGGAGRIYVYKRSEESRTTWLKLFHINGLGISQPDAGARSLGLSVGWQGDLLIAVAAETHVHMFSSASPSCSTEAETSSLQSTSAPSASAPAAPSHHGDAKEGRSSFSLVSSQQLVGPDDPLLSCKTCQVFAQRSGLLLLWTSSLTFYVFGTSEKDGSYDGGHQWAEEAFADGDALPNDLPSPARVCLVDDTLFGGWTKGLGAKLLAISTTD